ncbi:MAG: hypothetical protein AB7F32_04215 [Victivallaceae bacterium]
MAILLQIISSLIVLFVQAWLLGVAVRIVKEQINYRSAFIVTFGMMATQFVFGLLSLGFLGSLAGVVVMAILLKKLSTVEDTFPTAILIAVVFSFLSALSRLLLVALFSTLL